MQQIIANKISKKYGHSVIFRQLEARMSPGVHGIAGPNGSGKSTLMKCLSGLIRPDRGEIEWQGEKGSISREELTRVLGFSAPYVRLYDNLTCAENLQFVRELNGKQVLSSEIEDVLEKVGLTGKTEHFYGKLSSGQQQRARLAAAVIKNPDFLLLDEPGTNLDKAGFALLSKLIDTFRNRGAVTLIASNESRELDLCDAIVDLTDFQ